ncbi:MAG TPA: SpoIIE family protein phosphatase [Solirubrobacteraceae bacterium]|nr:SpoIIE family protein phosphatase [Solirubrobacteraceae bacterium]
MDEREESGNEELRRLRAERAEHLEALAQGDRDAGRDRETIDALRRGARADRETIRELREQAGRDAAHIREMEHDAVAAQRIAAAQRAVITELRSAVGEAATEAVDIGERLAAAERELVDLRAIRDALLSPTLVQRDGMTIAAEVIPAEPHVGGDFYYVGEGPQGTAVLAVGDVVGRGIQAARRAAFARTALASVANFSDDPCQLLRWVNVALVERIGESGDFVTVICLTVDPRTRRLRVASAGHHPGLKLDSGTELSGARTGAALGVVPEIRCASAEMTLVGGEGALLFTDGVIEARGPGSRFGVERLHASLGRIAGESPDRVIAAVKADLDRFTASEPRDDICLLAVRVD